MSEHTPGPWFKWSDISDGSPPSFIVVEDEYGTVLIAEVVDGSEADKALIITAPEMHTLAELTGELLDALYGGDEPQDPIPYYRLTPDRREIADRALDAWGKYLDRCDPKKRGR